MSVNQVILQDINFHIEKLERRLKDFYDLPSTSDYFIGREKQINTGVNVLDKIEVFNTFISIYSVLDQEDIKYSTTANEYANYLDNMRKGLEILKKEREEIESKNLKEITNIKLLLEQLYKKRNEIK
ncbi:hypothetical protein [Sporosarcina sp. Marseille-Q4943]|uniref:hypothetical protein n=1 Tax=Sporosarcina sp. Marseille-Q4943 TaxID=2942204 RepID=UPI00208DAD98|nr:hypothetical protein [Sporosarcina sp. Marseille-Q4943]